MISRTLIIGDVHGCIDELNDLLDKLAPTPNDQLIFLGDLIRKGPSSKEVYLKFKSLNAISLLGNHEWSVREQMEGRTPSRSSLKIVKNELGGVFDDFVSDIKTWKPYLKNKEFLAVHAGVVPGQKLKHTDEFSLVTIRTWDGTGEDLQNSNNPPWYDFYKKKKMVVFGHWAALGGVFKRNIIGLDTGCVYGGKLSALILPEKKIISVNARRVYAVI